MGAWKKTADEKLHNSYSSPNMRAIQKVISVCMMKLM
jgi:hypothetical protein